MLSLLLSLVSALQYTMHVFNKRIHRHRHTQQNHLLHHNQTISDISDEDVQCKHTKIVWELYKEDFHSQPFTALTPKE
jgi:hypothetical protein